MKRVAKIFFKVLLGVFFIFGGINHFRSPDFYLKIMPDYLPAHEFLVQLSGVTEVIAGVMLLVPAVSIWGAWFIIAHLIVFFTVHFWMIQHAADRYSDVPGGLAALWFRIVLQVVFIVWAWWFVTPNTAKAKVSSAAE